MTTVCIAASALPYPTGGGHIWAYLNWALGFRSAGCEVIWLEGMAGEVSEKKVTFLADQLRERLRPFGFADSLLVYSWGDEGGSSERDRETIERAAGADLLFNIDYGTPAHVIRSFKRTALLDIDPGLLQGWIARGEIPLEPYDVYFTIGETVGVPGSLIPNVGVEWVHTTPCVALDQWPVSAAAPDGAFTTLSQWHTGEWETDAEGMYSNTKRDGFLPYLDLPNRTSAPVELALNFADGDPNRLEVEAAGWTLKDPDVVAGTPDDYRRYVQRSLGEYSCAKPSCLRMQNAWVSDRTPCFLASGKPVILQFTGPSTFLPDSEGMFRFRDMDELLQAFKDVMNDYDRHARAARSLAEEHFDAHRNATMVLERALS